MNLYLPEIGLGKIGVTMTCSPRGQMSLSERFLRLAHKPAFSPLRSSHLWLEGRHLL